MSLREIGKAVIVSDEAKVAVTKSAGGVAIYGITLNEWVAIVTFIYFVLQIYFLIKRAIKEGKKDE